MHPFPVEVALLNGLDLDGSFLLLRMHALHGPDPEDDALGPAKLRRPVHLASLHVVIGALSQALAQHLRPRAHLAPTACARRPRHRRPVRCRTEHRRLGLLDSWSVFPHLRTSGRLPVRGAMAYFRPLDLQSHLCPCLRPGEDEPGKHWPPDITGALDAPRLPAWPRGVRLRGRARHHASKCSRSDGLQVHVHLFGCRKRQQAQGLCYHLLVGQIANTSAREALVEHLRAGQFED
mmetsp:Transcript_6310/g.23696  ORF Transcript_6310/g.23696 Transcript_6310/m.23696 type:complete len:235 (-) Transcript_6310:244-948(-)